MTLAPRKYIELGQGLTPSTMRHNCLSAQIVNRSVALFLILHVFMQAMQMDDDPELAAAIAASLQDSGKPVLPPSPAAASTSAASAPLLPHQRPAANGNHRPGQNGVTGRTQHAASQSNGSSVLGSNTAGMKLEVMALDFACWLLQVFSKARYLTTTTTMYFVIRLPSILVLMYVAGGLYSDGPSQLTVG